MGRWAAVRSFVSEAALAVAARLRPHAEVLARRWRTVAGCAAGALVLASVICLLVPARYTATARLRLEPLAREASASSRNLDVPEEVALLRSRVLVAEVIRQLGLEQNADFVNGRRRVGGLALATRGIKRLRKATRGPAPDPQDDADADERALLDVPGALIVKYRSWLDVAATRNARTIEVRFTSPSPELSQQVASAHAAQYVRRRQGLRSQLTGEPATFLEEEIDRVQAELRKGFLAATPEFHDLSAQLRSIRGRLDREMARATSAIESRLIVARGTETSLQNELRRAETGLRGLDEVARQAIELDEDAARGNELYEALRTRKQEADLLRGMQLSTALRLDPAPLPSRPSEPRVFIDLGLFLLAGLVLGALVALRLEGRHARLETPDDVRRALGLRPLGVVPDFGRLARPDAAADPSIAAEAYRGVRTAPGFLDPQRPPRSVVVTSSQPGEGKTATAGNLAISLAALDCRVILVDAALRGAAVHRALGLPPGPGLTDVVRGKASLAAATRGIDPTTGRTTPAAGAGALHVLPAGTPAGDPADILGSARWHEILRSLAGRYDTVVIDG